MKNAGRRNSVNSDRRKFSVCIPAFNRARHLESLLDSVFSQDYKNFEVVICEDDSPERERIEAIVRRYSTRYPDTISYFENEQNLGYDANIRNLVAKARGEFCFFLGNDDLMCPGALTYAAGILSRYSNAGLVLKSYAWFDSVPEAINQEVRYFSDERLFASGYEAITVCFRRSGVISGYIVDRDAAHAAATDRFDGTLYYQLHLTASVLAYKRAVYTPEILVLCRNGEAPGFGRNWKEAGKFIPGRYTPESRLNMIDGALSIIKFHDRVTQDGLTKAVMHDYANYFYPYIKDQLTLNPFGFVRLYFGFAKMGFYKYPMFHLYCLAAYFLGEKRCDEMTRRVRGYLGRSPQFGIKQSGR
jgi:glycosyltransferase involved in cell wall biosynthesis